MITLDLPRPPSTNALFTNVPGVGRRKTADYRRWQEAAGWAIAAARQPAVLGPYAVFIGVSRADGVDIDNVVKATLDILVKHRLTDDDKRCDKLVVQRDDDTPKSRIRVFVEAA